MRVRLLNLNAWALMPPVGRSVAPRMRAIAERLPEFDADLVALQEIWTESARNTLIEAGRKAGLVHAWHNPAVRSGSGLMILSRFPIRAHSFEAFELGGFPEAIQHSDYWAGKGLAEVSFASPVGEFRLITSHLHAAYGARANDPYVGHRIGQVLQLVEGVRRGTSPVLLAGDMNFIEGSEESSILLGFTSLVDVAQHFDRAVPTSLASNPYRDPGWEEQRIDYIFHQTGKSATLKPVAIDRVLDEVIEIENAPGAYSDHAGLLAEFQMAEGGETPRRADPGAAVLAEEGLAQGQAQAEARQAAQRQIAGVGLLGAPAAWAARRTPLMTRRRALRSALSVAAIGALGLGGFSLYRSEALRNQELAAYDSAFERLERIRREVGL